MHHHFNGLWDAPHHSCHAPGVLKCSSTVSSTVWKHSAGSRKIKCFTSALRDISSTSKRINHHQNAPSINKPLFLHLPFTNPADTSSATIQRAFDNLIVAPFQEEHITDLPTLNQFEGQIDLDHNSSSATTNKKASGETYSHHGLDALVLTSPSIKPWKH